MKGKRVRIGCAAASLLMGISGTYAYYRSSVETINKIAVGDVNIGIWEYEEDGDGEKKYEGPENGIVLPSQVISKIPRITNYAEPCYVRVKPVFDEEETQDYRLGKRTLGNRGRLAESRRVLLLSQSAGKAGICRFFPYNHHSICVDQ